jgi:uncharacterized protein YcbX
VAHVSQLVVYPVKGCRGVPLASVAPDARGLAGDRRWMVVDASGRFLSQRTEPRLALIRMRPGPAGTVLEAPGLPPLSLPDRAEGPLRAVEVWDDRGQARDGGAAPREWLSRHLGREAHLVQLDEGFERTAPAEYAPGAPLAFNDAYPVLLIGEASLDELNRRLERPLSMSRFRPNVVVSGSAPFAEDGWRRIRVGEAILRLVKPCSRCVATTVDQESAETGVEPLRTLATFRRWNGGGIFGQNAVLELPAPMRVGDPIEVLESGELTAATSGRGEPPPPTGEHGPPG